MKPHNHFRHYAVRRLNPFQGVIQVAGDDEARAISPNGREWEIQIRAERPEMWGAESAGEPVTQFLRFGLWSAGTGLSRIPAHPLLDLTAMLEKAHELTGFLALKENDLPFPLTDRFELWLLDGKARMPLALLASSSDKEDLHKPRVRRWHCANRSFDDFPAPETASARPPHPRDTDPHPHMSRLERMVAMESGHSIAQWFERDESGAGSGQPLKALEELSHRRLAPHCFPELLIREAWPDPLDRSLVRDYLHWLSPRLLTLQHISDKTRGRLERAARAQAVEVAETWSLYPRIMDREVIEAARVEARLRQARRGS